jgi:hypothetical protein
MEGIEIGGQDVEVGERCTVPGLGVVFDYSFGSPERRGHSVQVQGDGREPACWCLQGSLPLPVGTAGER